LAAALRTDRAECVRLEAAIALNRGCCCTRMIVEALEDCVGGTDKLGPSENSCRVQAIAAMALDRCLCCPEAMAVIEEPVPTNENKEPREEPRRLADPDGSKSLPPATPLTPSGPSFGPTAKGSGKPSRAEIEHARQTLALAQARIMHRAEAAQPAIPTGQRSIAGLANYVMNGAPPAQRQTAMPPAAPPAPVHAVARTTTSPATPPAMTRPVPASATVTDSPKPTQASAAATDSPKPAQASVAVADLHRPAPPSVTIAEVTIPAYKQPASPTAEPVSPMVPPSQRPRNRSRSST
jgi:hypothetical protein